MTIKDEIESSVNKNIYCVLQAMILLTGMLFLPVAGRCQSSGEETADRLAGMGFENVRWTENGKERIYTIENTVYKANGVGIGKAVDVIQENGLPQGEKDCRIIVLNYNIPQISLTYSPQAGDSLLPGRNDWKVSYDIDDSWKEVKGARKRNSSLFKYDIVVYPKLSYMNLIITQIYQALFTLCPTLEMSCWPGMKLTAQVVLPVYNDGYGTLNDKVHPEYITVSQRFRLPYNIYGRVIAGIFNANRYGVDFTLSRPFKFDERFSLDARVGYTGIGYWEGFHYHYGTQKRLTWSVGGSFYWPKYNTQFSLKGEQYLLKEKGVRFDMIRHFRYTSVGFYAMKAEHANSNGGFTFIVNLGINKYKRQKYIPKMNIGDFGIVYNAGNEQYYYRSYNAEASDNIMEKNKFNPYFIKSELLNF